MSIKANFSEVTPSLVLDFANSKTLDPRITFSRASTATYYDGITSSKAEENFILYSQQFNFWNNLDISLTADSDIAPDGTQTADKLVPNANNTRHISYLTSSAITNNLPYTYSAYFKAAGYNFAQLGLFLNSGGVDAYIIIDLTNGTVTDSAGNTGVRGTFNFSVQSVGNGWYRGIITCGNVTSISTGQGIILAASNSGTPSLTAAGSPTFSGDGTSGILIWGAQLEQRSAATAYTATTSSAITRYQPTLVTASTNTPRFDHNPTTGKSLGLLMEEQKTNLLTYSEDLTNNNWVKQNQYTVTGNTTISPNGTLTANSISRANVTLDFMYQLASGSGTYTISAWVKVASGTETFFMQTYSATDGVIVSPTFTATTEWQRFSATITVTAGTTGWYPCIPTALSLNKTFFVWGVQLESGLFATSYIPTTDSQVTRSADFTSLTGTNFSSWYRSDEGTFYADITRISLVSSNSQSVFGTNVQYSDLALGAGGANFRFGTGSGIDLTVVNSSLSAKYAASYESNSSHYLSVNGGAVGSKIQTTALPNSNALYLGKGDGTASTFPLNGWFEKFIYYPKRLTNDQLQNLTK